MGYDDLAAALRAEFGVSWFIYDTSGGNYTLRAVIEGGLWVHITDAYDSLSHMDDRVARFFWGDNVGYGVSVFTEPDADGFVYGNENTDAVTHADVIALVRDALDHIPAGTRPRFR
jgi:hypothetical protein